MMAQPDAEPVLSRRPRSERLLACLEPYARVVLVSHVNPDPDALGCMLGLQALLALRQPGKPVILTITMQLRLDSTPASSPVFANLTLLPNLRDLST